jgi:SIR2-like domain
MTAPQTDADNAGHVIYLLGAGAARDIGLPDSVGLLKEIQESMAGSANAYTKQVVEDLVGALKYHKGSINFEDLLSAIGVLAHPEKSELWPFVSELGRPFAEIMKRQPDFFGELHRRILGFVRYELGLNEIDLTTDPRVSYLRKLIGLAKESTNPTIFTLNYDLSLERIMDAESVKYSTGFLKPKGIHAGYLTNEIAVWPLGWLRTDIEMYPHLFDQTEDGEEADIRLVKIHGSLDWFRIPQPPIYEGGQKLFPEDPIIKCDLPPPQVVEETIIAGRSGKQRLNEPFLTLLREFHYKALQASVIVTIGYSFSDEHINRVLVNAQLAERSNSFDLIVINPNWPSTADGDGSMSVEAREAWRLLFLGGEESFNRENFSRVQVLPFSAAVAIQAGYLRKALAEVLEQRRRRTNY